MNEVKIARTSGVFGAQFAEYEIQFLELCVLIF